MCVCGLPDDRARVAGIMYAYYLKFKEEVWRKRFCRLRALYALVVCSEWPPFLCHAMCTQVNYSCGNNSLSSRFSINTAIFQSENRDPVGGGACYRYIAIY